MQLWLISLPPSTRVILSALQNLALLEFIPDEQFKDFLKSIVDKISGSDDDCKDKETCSE